MKYMRVRLNRPILMHMLTEGSVINVIVRKGLPDGAEFRYIIEGTAGIDLVVEHDSFEQLKDGDVIPIFPDILFDTIDSMHKLEEFIGGGKE